MIAIIQGQEVKVGDSVGFKADIEQSGEIVKIEKARRGSGWILTLKSNSDRGFIGEYIGGDRFTTEESDRCWL